MDSTNNALKPGTVLQGKAYTYILQKVLGQGSFGITYLATTRVKVSGALGEIESTIQVAIKEFFMRDINGRSEDTVTTGSQGGLYANYKKKFAREAENLSKLHHPHIVKVLEYFEANNTVYYAMEYMEGGSLDDRIRQQNGLPEAEAVKYARQIGSALSYMHAHKVLHLDLKPGNVMLRKDGEAVLIDFGLSKQYDENGEPESSTTVGNGTPGYAPTEQADYQEGKDFPVTMDVYALGATMFKMLTGVRPPKASVVLNDGFPAYVLQQRGVSDSLISCIAHAMASLKKDRLPNVEAFLQRLGTPTEEKTETQKVETEPAAASAPATQQRKNLKYLWLALAAALLVGVIYRISRPDSEGGESLIAQSIKVDTAAIQQPELIERDSVPVPQPKPQKEVTPAEQPQSQQPQPLKEEHVPSAHKPEPQKEVTQVEQPQQQKLQPLKEETVTPPVAQRTENEPKDAQAQYELGLKYYEEKNYSEAATWYRKAAEQGHVRAQYELGGLYHIGRGVTKDNQKAFKWYRKAADQGYADAQNGLGYIYQIGLGVTRDYQEAIKWYRKAAEQGHANAQYNLGRMYDYRWGVTQDYQEAIKWYRKAVEQGNTNAQTRLGYMYKCGLGVAKDGQEAIKWFRKAAEQGDVGAQYALGETYRNGQGVTKDYEEAAKWYRKAAEQGDVDAQYYLGYMYRNGQGVTKDYSEAAKWYRKAAEQGHDDAQYNLGFMYDNGLGVAEDEQEAIKWYRKAAKQGHYTAKNALREFGAE